MNKKIKFYKMLMDLAGLQKKRLKIIEPGIIDSENNKNGGLETHSNENLLELSKRLCKSKYAC